MSDERWLLVLVVSIPLKKNKTSNWIIFSGRVENRKYLKPPIRLVWMVGVEGWLDYWGLKAVVEMVLMMTARHKAIILSRAVGFGGATVPSWRSLEYRTVTRSVIFVKKVPCWYTKIIPRSSRPKTSSPPSHPPGASHLPMYPWAFVQAAHFRHEFGVDICRSCQGKRLRFQVGSTQVSTRVCWWHQHSQHSQHSHICWGWPYTSFFGIQTNWRKEWSKNLSSRLHKNPGQPVPPGTFDICRRGAWTGGIEMNEDIPITTATSTLWQCEVIWDNHRWKGIVVMRWWMIMMDTAEMMDKNDGW